MNILVVLVFLLATQIVYAQAMGGQGSAGGPNKQEIAAKLEKLSAALQLTPAQKQQIVPILKQEVPQLEAMKNNTSLGPLQKGMQLKEIRSATDAKVMPILNPEQQQKFQAIREQERQEMMKKLESQ